jgi:hypothetical protein
MEWMRMVRVQKQNIERLNIYCYILCHRCLQHCQVSVLTLMPLVCPVWLLCCLLSSTTSASRHTTAFHPAAPHLSTSCCTTTSCCAPLLLWCAHLLAAQAVCHVPFHHATTSCPPVHLPLIASLPLIAAKLGSHGGKDYTKVMAISRGMEQRR